MDRIDAGANQAGGLSLAGSGIAPHNDREVHVACIPAWDHHHLGWILARGPIVTQGRRNIKNLGGDKP